MSRSRTGSRSSAGAIPHPPVVDVASVVEKLRAIEHRFAPPSGSDARALRAQLDAWRTREPDEDLEFEIPESFARVLFTKLCERHGVTAHRHTGDSLKICVRMPHGFATDVLWPQYDAMGAEIARFVHGQVSNVLTAWLKPAD